MSAERTPQGQYSLLARLMGATTRLVVRFPVATVTIGVAVACVAIFLTATRLGFRTSRLDLLNPKSDYNRLWIEYIKEFGDDDDAVVVVEGEGRDQVVPVLQEISQALVRREQLFHAVLHEVDLGKVRGKGLHYLSEEELQGLERFLSDVGPILHGNWSLLNLGRMAEGMCARLEAAARQPTDPRNAETDVDVERFSASLLAALSQGGRYQSPWPSMPQSFATLSELSGEYLLTKEGKLGFVILRLAKGKDEFARSSEATDALRDLIAQMSARHPETKIGLTGLPIMENDEMRSSQSSMFWASLLSMVGVGCLFVAGFGGVRHALLANIVLLLGMAWAFGYVTLSVGHLNILSVSFTATLIGVGIDYGVYYAARYLQLRDERQSCPEALVHTSLEVGPAILTGAITTAVAFFAAGFTNFTGIAELGIIAGGGILLCALAELVVLPAAICLVDRSGYGRRMPEALPVQALINPLLKMPRLVLLTTVAATVFVSLGLGRLWYDHNLLNMQPVGLESVELERKLLSESNQSVWYALSIAETPEELLKRKAELLKLPSVERTEEIVSLLPADHQAKRPVIERIRQRLESLDERPPLIPVDKPEELGRLMARAQELIARRNGRSRALLDLEQSRDKLRRMNPSDCNLLTSAFQQQMAGDLLSRLYVLKSMANPEPPTTEDLPESLTSRFVGPHGLHLLKIYGRGNIWDMDALGEFVKDVRTVDPRATGNPLQAYEASLEMKQSYEKAALYAFAVIATVLLFDFRSVRYTLLALLPLGIGVLQTFGVLGLLGIPLNPANMIALPLLLGIGVDEGVHIVHDFLDQRGRYTMSQSTAVAVLVDSLTTIVGFGALMIASHQGLQSLGRVLTIGVTCCLFTSMVMLPALLTWLTRHREVAPPAIPTAPSVEARREMLRRRYDPRQQPPAAPHELPAVRRTEVRRRAA
ncbi:MAG: MMPL family transporter [Planctomycetia bacterium]|nr:MMPL family transporter [Planctomycetia bacterium]